MIICSSFLSVSCTDKALEDSLKLSGENRAELERVLLHYKDNPKKKKAGFVTNGFVYTSGQIPVNPADGTIPAGIAAQAQQSCKNVGAILEAGGSSFEKVVKTTCFLADIADFATFNEVYAKFFTSKPARSCVAVKDLPKGVLCEIEAIAEA